MLLKKTLNIVLTILVLSAGALLAFLFFSPEGAVMAVQPPPAPSALLVPAKPETAVESDTEEPVISPETLAKMFHTPTVKRREEALVVEEEPEAPQIFYDTTRLIYLGFVVSEGQKKFLIKDTLYEDVFRIGLGEEVFGFNLIEEEAQGKSLILKDEEKLYRILIW